jgi:hypothetical protein
MVLAKAAFTPPPYLFRTTGNLPGHEVRTERDLPGCPRQPILETDASMSISAAHGYASELEPNTYTVTAYDRGGDSATDVELALTQPNPGFSRIDIDGLTCTAFRGAVCPDFSTRPAIDHLPIMTSIPKLPIGSKVVIVFRATPIVDSAPGCPSPDATLAPYAEISPGRSAID